jgi:hypothetical protein
MSSGRDGAQIKAAVRASRDVPGTAKSAISLKSARLITFREQFLSKKSVEGDQSGPSDSRLASYSVRLRTTSAAKLLSKDQAVAKRLGGPGLGHPAPGPNHPTTAETKLRMTADILAVWNACWVSAELWLNGVIEQRFGAQSQDFRRQLLALNRDNGGSVVVAEHIWTAVFLVMCIVGIGVCLVYIFSREQRH